MGQERARRRCAGFSVIEVLIAAAIFLVIAVGLLPLFVQSIRNNLAGREATDVSNMGKSRVEELFQLDFKSARLEPPGGGTELWVTDYYVMVTDGYGGQGYWTTGTPPGGAVVPWERTTRVRQFGINNGEFDLETPLPGGTSANLVHLKEIRVEVNGRRSLANPFGGGRQLVLQVLKAK